MLLSAFAECAKCAHMLHDGQADCMDEVEISTRRLMFWVSKTWSNQ